jgi:hypothetical protein
MNPLEVLQNALKSPLVDEDGEKVRLEILSGLTEQQIVEFATDIPCILPAEIRELLAFTQGFSDFADVDFTGRNLGGFELPEIFPHGLAIAADGFGNFWVVDLNPESVTWGPIYFVCHDPPVVLYQSPTLDHFLIELFKCVIPPHKSLVNDVHDDRVFNVWRKNPNVWKHEDCAHSSDPQLKAFASELHSTFEIIDMRTPEIGFGFSFGRYGPKTVIKRFGALPIFPPPSRSESLITRRSSLLSVILQDRLGSILQHTSHFCKPSCRWEFARRTILPSSGRLARRESRRAHQFAQFDSQHSLADCRGDAVEPLQSPGFPGRQAVDSRHQGPRSSRRDLQHRNAACERRGVG